jgi:hypothetical protein
VFGSEPAVVVVGVDRRAGAVEVICDDGEPAANACQGRVTETSIDAMMVANRTDFTAEEL